MDDLFKVDGVTGVRRMFYAVTPNETSFETLDEVPHYILEATPFFMISLILEEIVLRFQDGGKEDRLVDGMTSIVAGMFMIITGLFTKAMELGIYVYVFENFCLFELPWDSPWTWSFSFVAVDLGYYWLHRMLHEVNIMWAAHQVHHSSEEYNLSTALRQSIFQRCFSWMFYLPMAFFAPPSSMFVHMQFNTLYQFWIHTEIISEVMSYPNPSSLAPNLKQPQHVTGKLIRNLGPLEYILNTPSHHRVHHGRNRYCIDKNYAGTLIIWDRMFGTFAEEDDQVAYGLVHPLQTYNPITVQFCHLQWMWSVFWSTPGLMNKISVILKGPGWEPGKPRTGLIEDIPDVCGPEPNKYKTPIPGWLRAYILLHFLINLLLFQLFMNQAKQLSQLRVIIGLMYQIYTFTCIGMLCDLKPWWNVLAEMARCAVVFAVTSLAIHWDAGPGSGLLFLQVTYGLSVLFWFLRPGSLGDMEKLKST